MSTKTHKLPHYFIFCFLILIGIGFGHESDNADTEELRIPPILAQNPQPAQLHEHSQEIIENDRPSSGRGIASFVPLAPALATDPHDCEAARDAHIHDPITDSTLTEDDAMEQFVSSSKGQALMDEFINTVEMADGQRVLKIDIAQDFEQSLEHLDHTSASDSL